jgi:hypothetical protein
MFIPAISACESSTPGGCCLEEHTEDRGVGGHIGETRKLVGGTEGGAGGGVQEGGKEEGEEEGGGRGGWGCGGLVWRTKLCDAYGFWRGWFDK